MKKVAVLFGGKSTEHDVSIVSGTSVIFNMDKTKYMIYPIYISKEGKKMKPTDEPFEMNKVRAEGLEERKLIKILEE